MEIETYKLKCRNKWEQLKGKIVKNGEKKNTKEKIKPTKLWKRKNNEKKIKIGKETNKYSLSGKIHWKWNKYSPREKIYKRNKE
jgi:hypothetical protein